MPPTVSEVPELPSTEKGVVVVVVGEAVDVVVEVAGGVKTGVPGGVVAGAVLPSM